MDPLQEFAFYVKAIQREIERQTNDAMRPLGVTAAQADAIVVIGQAEPLSLKDLGDLLIAEAGHPSRLVDRLVEAGLVERTTASDDRRRVELRLTAEGRRLHRKAMAVRERVISLFRDFVGDRDIGPALDLLRTLVQGTPIADLVARRDHLDSEARP